MRRGRHVHFLPERRAAQRIEDNQPFLRQQGHVRSLNRADAAERHACSLTVKLMDENQLEPAFRVRQHPIDEYLRRIALLNWLSERLLPEHLAVIGVNAVDLCADLEDDEMALHLVKA